MSKLSEDITEPIKNDSKSFLEGLEDVPVTLATMWYQNNDSLFCGPAHGMVIPELWMTNFLWNVRVHPRGFHDSCRHFRNVFDRFCDGFR